MSLNLIKCRTSKNPYLSIQFKTYFHIFKSNNWVLYFGILSAFFSYNTKILKKQKKNMNEINEESNSLSLGFAPLQMKPVQYKRVETENVKRLDSVIASHEHSMIKVIQIVSAKRFRGFQFLKELKNYRFQRNTRAPGFMSQLNVAQDKQVQQLLAAFRNIYKEWRKKISNKFYMSFSNGDLTYFLHKPQSQDLKKNQIKGGSFVLINTRYSGLVQKLKAESIPFDILRGLGQQQQIILIKNNAIHLYWRYLFNYTVQKSTTFEMVSNFSFLNCCEILPIQIYNGKQQKPQFEYLSSNETNLLGEPIRQLYSLKLQGCWMHFNIEKLKQRLEKQVDEGKFTILLEAHPSCQHFWEEIKKL